MNFKHLWLALVSFALLSCAPESNMQSATQSSRAPTAAQFLKELEGSNPQAAKLISYALLLNDLHLNLEKLNVQNNEAISRTAKMEAGVAGGVFIFFVAFGGVIAGALASIPLVTFLFVVHMFTADLAIGTALNFYKKGEADMNAIAADVDGAIKAMGDLQASFVNQVWKSKTPEIKSYLAAANQYLSYKGLSLEDPSLKLGYFYLFKVAKNGIDQPIENCPLSKRRVVTHRSSKSKIPVYEKATTSSRVLGYATSCYMFCLRDASDQLVFLSSGAFEGYLDRTFLSTVEDAKSLCKLEGAQYFVE